MKHTPVLVRELVELWQPKDGDRLLDATLGLGGHTRAFLEASGPSGSVVGLDADEAALVQARQNLAEFGSRVQYIHRNFSQVKDLEIGGGILFSHVLFDLGLGSHQIDDPSRGFSFVSSGPLLMKYGQVEKLPPAQLSWLNHLERTLGHLPEAVEILAVAQAAQLEELISHYGEERFASWIAQAIKRREAVPITAVELTQLIARAVPPGYERGRINPATRTFQALRLAVNRELEVLQAALPQALELLTPGGILTVISFHSLEDRIVKQFMRSRQETNLTILTKHPIRAEPDERQRNPRARSAKLRAARKV